MQRERYGVVKDERDAYHELQDQFSAQLDMAFQQVEMTSQEKDRVLAECNQLKKDMEDSEFFLKKMGTLVGVGYIFRHLISEAFSFCTLLSNPLDG